MIVPLILQFLTYPNILGTSISNLRVHVQKPPREMSLAVKFEKPPKSKSFI